MTVTDVTRSDGPTARTRRAVARLMPWWIRLLVLAVVVPVEITWPAWIEWPLLAGLFGLVMTRPPHDPDREPVRISPPVRGRWVARNSPVTKVPSHGVKAYGQSNAIDILRPEPSGSGPSFGWGGGMHRPEHFPTFGEPVLAMADGVVVATSARQRDHRTRRSWWSLAYLMLVEGFVREVGGPRFVLGNHVIIDHGDDVYSASAHLRRGSLLVEVGDRVRAGDQVASVGNSGNSTEPHLHVQMMDRPIVTAAAGIAFQWTQIEVEGRPAGTGLPANGQIFETG